MTWQDDRLSKRLTFSPEQTEALYAILSEIDAVKHTFRLTDRLAPQTINRLTQSVIVTSTGASNRIEGNRLSDDEVEALYRNMHIRKFRTRDEQEVAGYLEMLELVLASYADMPVTEALILQLHRDMLKYSDKDERQRGTYKFGPNRVEAKDQSGNIIGVISQRLIRLLCQSCKTEKKPTELESQLLDIEFEDKKIKIFDPVGCSLCDNTGYKGRLAIIEALRINDELDEQIAKRATLGELKATAKTTGYKTLADDAIRCVLEGRTSIAEVSRVIDLTQRVM